MKKYFVYIPGWVYALNFHAKNEKEARAKARNWLGLEKLPNGTAVWPAVC